jgi:hypothetical protein
MNLEVYFVAGQNFLVFQYQVEQITVYSTVGGFVVYEDATICLLSLTICEFFDWQEDVDMCAHACHKPCLVAVKVIV